MAVLLLAALDQSGVYMRSGVPQVFLVRTFWLVVGKHSPDDHLETQDSKKRFFTLHKWWQHYCNFLFASKGQQRSKDISLLSSATRTLYVYYSFFPSAEVPFPVSEDF